MKKILKTAAVLLVAAGMLFSTAAYMRRGTSPSGGYDTIFLLVPDAVELSAPDIQEWLDAAEEEGLHLKVIRDSNFLDPMFGMQAAGLIVPDQVHRTANDALVGALDEYVSKGGKLMLVYDACTWDLNGHFPELGSRLSDLAGVNYALYGQYGKHTMMQSQVWGTARAMEELEIPPGKFVPMDKHNRPALWQEVSLGKGKDDTRYTLVAYKYDDLPYPSFRTAGQFDGKVLLESSAGLVAGARKYGAGEVLFVNLPLGYLESRTDGLLLHSFLRYFADRLLQLPYLASVPDGMGGLVLNWHIDARSAIKPLEFLRARGLFNYGPFSMHLTSGPDVDSFHDGKGLNVDNNPEAQKWIEFFRKRGDEVGSHGGWIHNYFGQNVDDHNEFAFEKYLDLNKKSLDHALGEDVTAYSAPMGNHPEWVTQWLAKNGFVAYYFAGDAGMGPTLVYRDHGRDASSVWAFPVLNLGPEASLEEMGFAGVSQLTVQEWLCDVADFAAQNHVARLVYSHPLGAIQYIQPLLAWMAHTSDLANHGEFRWYTMTGLANFLNTRRQVEWTLKAGKGKVSLEASHPKTLDHQTWILDKSRYRNLRVAKGKAEIQAVEDKWLINAGDCTHLEIKMEEQRAASNQTPPS